MSTELGTYLGTSLGTTLGTGDGESELAILEFYLARNLFSWIRADYRTLVDYGGGDVRVSAFPDKVALVSEGAVAPNARSVDPAHAFAQVTQANQVASTTTNALFGNREVAVFTSAQFYDSTLGAADWKFFHGNQWEWWCTFAPTAGGVGVIFASTNSSTAPGQQPFTNAGDALSVVGADGAALLVATMTGAGAQNVAQCLNFRFLEGGGSPEYTGRKNSTVLTTGDSAVAPSANNPAAPLRIGGQPGGMFKPSMLFAELMVSPALSTTLRSAVARYQLLRYGLS